MNISQGLFPFYLSEAFMTYLGEKGDHSVIAYWALEDEAPDETLCRFSTPQCGCGGQDVRWDLWGYSYGIRRGNPLSIAGFSSRGNSQRREFECKEYSSSCRGIGKRGACAFDEWL